MNYYLTEEKVNYLNQNHKHYIDLYVDGNSYKVGAIIYSHIVKVENSTLFLDVYINNDWKKDNQETAILFVNQWLSKNEELNPCKFYKASLYLTKSLGFTIHKDNNQDEIIKQIINQYKPLKSESTLQCIFSNSAPTNLLKRLKNTFKPYSFATTIYKLQADLDLLLFHSIYLDSFVRLLCFDDDEKDFYNENIVGMPTVLRIESKRSNYADVFPSLKYSKLPNHSQYAIMTFKETDFSFSTKAVLNIRGVELNSIEIYKFVRFEGSKLIAKADKQKLKEIKLI